MSYRDHLLPEERTQLLKLDLKLSSLKEDSKALNKEKRKIQMRALQRQWRKEHKEHKA